MTTFGHLTVIKRNRSDGSKLPLKTSSCLIGRDEECDVRIQLPNVSQKHCRIDVLPSGEILLINLSNLNPTLLNGNEIVGSVMMAHGDLFTVSDRSFRWDFLPSSPYYSEKPLVSAMNGRSSTSSLKTRLSSENKTKRKSPTANKTPSTISPAKKKRRLSPSVSFSSKKVSYGQAISPVTTPNKKVGRPSSRRPSAPSFYGNPILTPVRTKTRANQSPSNKLKTVSQSQVKASSDSKTPETKKSPLKKRKSSSAKMKFSLIGKRKSKSPSSATGRSGTKKDRVSYSPKKSTVRMLLGLDNAVKIVSPASPDSKKSAALRTIHAGKLKLKKSKSTQYLMKRKKALNRRHPLKVQLPFGRVSPTKGGKVTGNRSTLHDNTKNSVTSPSDDYKSPDISKDTFISPLNTPNNALIKSSAVKRYLRNGVERSFKSLENGSAKTTPGKKRSYGKKQNKSPVSDYSDVRGVERLMRSPQKSPKSDYSDVRGVKRLMKSPAKSPKSDYSDVFGLKRLMRTPRASPKADYSDVKGVKNLMRTPRRSSVVNYSEVEGVDRMFRRSKSPRMTSIKSSKKSSPVKKSIKSQTPPFTPVMRSLENILGSVGKSTRSAGRTPIGSKANTPKSSTRGQLKLKKTSPSVLKTPLKGSDNIQGSLERSTRSPTKRSSIDVEVVEAPMKKTPKMRMTPEFVGRVTRSARKVAPVSPKVKTPKSANKRRGRQSTTVVEIQTSSSPDSKVPLSSSTKTTRQTRNRNMETSVVEVTATPNKTLGRFRKVQSTPNVELLGSPKETPQSTQTTRKTTCRKVLKSLVEIEEVVTTTTRTRSKKVAFVGDKTKSPFTPKPTKIKRGTPKKSETKSNSPVVSTPSPKLTERKTRVAVKKSPPTATESSPKARVRLGLLSPKIENTTPSPRAKTPVVNSTKTKKVKTPKQILRSPIMTRTSLRNK